MAEHFQESNTYPSTIRKVETTDPVSADIANRATQGLVNRTNYLNENKEGTISPKRTAFNKDFTDRVGDEILDNINPADDYYKRHYQVARGAETFMYRWQVWGDLDHQYNRYAFGIFSEYGFRNLSNRPPGLPHSVYYQLEVMPSFKSVDGSDDTKSYSGVQRVTSKDMFATRAYQVNEAGEATFEDWKVYKEDNLICAADLTMYDFIGGFFVSSRYTEGLVYESIGNSPSTGKFSIERMQSGQYKITHNLGSASYYVTLQGVFSAHSELVFISLDSQGSNDFVFSTFSLDGQERTYLRSESVRFQMYKYR